MKELKLRETHSLETRGNKDLQKSDLETSAFPFLTRTVGEESLVQD